MLGLGKGNKVECIGRKEREIQSPMQCQYLNLIKRLKKKRERKLEEVSCGIGGKSGNVFFCIKK